MGNTNAKNDTSLTQNHTKRVTIREPRNYSSQFSLSNIASNLSGRSFLSITSNQSTYSFTRPESRVSGKRKNEGKNSCHLSSSKTLWHVPKIESIFQPEFPISTELKQTDFVIEDTIARGAFGKVYKVKRLSEEKDYALKVLSKSKIVSENAVRQLKEEASIQAACGHHTFIVGCVAKWQTRQRIYIVSEYVPGGEFLNLLDRYGCLPEELVKIFVAELALVIDFLHNAGVIYRDLKPENILLDEDCHIKLIDFGLSKWLSYGSRTTTICGTFNYIAPEVLSHEPYGHAVDWWSLGVVACKMLTLQFPAPAIDTSKVETADTETVVEILKPGRLPDSAINISEASKKLLMHLLELNPKHRMKSLRQLEQSALFMGFNFENVKSKKICPKKILAEYFPENWSHEYQIRAASEELFTLFENASLV